MTYTLIYTLLKAPASAPLIFLLAILLLFYLASRKPERIGNWSHLFEGMQHDPEGFYADVEEFLKSHEVPGYSTRKQYFKEEGVLSHQRVYLEVTRGQYRFHICAAPWGTDFFFSWWLNYRVTRFELLLLRVPILGGIIASEQPYYKLDSDTMFRTSVHQAVLEGVDKVAKAKGIKKGLTELERKPDLKSMYRVRVHLS